LTVSNFFSARHEGVATNLLAHCGGRTIRDMTVTSAEHKQLMPAVWPRVYTRPCVYCGAALLVLPQTEPSLLRRSQVGWFALNFRAEKLHEQEVSLSFN
jgi:hypothetical protein